MPAALLLALGLAAPDQALVAPNLSERFAERVSLSSAAAPAERALYDEAMRLVLNTPTGRSLAEELLIKDRRVEVAFKDLDGIYGLADCGDGALARVSVSRGHLTWRPELAALVLAETLAHELLGHVLQQRRAEEAGVGFEFNSSLLDELNAEAVGWTVGFEAGWPYPNARAEELAAKPAAYAEELVWGGSSYSEGLARAELADPVAAYEGRLAALDRRVSDPALRAKLKARFEARVALLKSREDLRASFSRAASDPFFDRLEADMAARASRLQGLDAAAKARFTAPGAGAPPMLVCGRRPGA